MHTADPLLYDLARSATSANHPFVAASFVSASLGNSQDMFSAGSLATTGVGAGAVAVTRMSAQPSSAQGQGLFSASSLPVVGAAGNAVPRRAHIYQSCQARVSLWRQLEVRGGSVTRGALLGKGSYAEVYAGTMTGSIECAIKVYRSTASAKQRQEGQREIKLAGESLGFSV